MKIIYLAVLIGLPLFTFGQIDPIDVNGLAIGGYDIVEYFQSNKAVKGDHELESIFNNAKYLFSSQENLDRFKSDPERYLPQYEGYCALAIGTTGKKISIDPHTFKVTNGKLYLFFNGRSFSGTKFNSLEAWLEDEPGLIRKADAIWPTVKNRKYKAQSR